MGVIMIFVDFAAKVLGSDKVVELASKVVSPETMRTWEPYCREQCSKLFYNTIGQIYWPEVFVVVEAAKEVIEKNLIETIKEKAAEVLASIDPTTAAAITGVTIAASGALYYVTHRNGKVVVEKQKEAPSTQAQPNEEARLAKEQQQAFLEEEARLAAEEQAQHEEEARLAQEEQAQREAEERLAKEQQTLIEEEARLAAQEQAQREEEARLAAQEQAQREEEARLAQEKQTEMEVAARIEKAAQALREEAARKEEAARLEKEAQAQREEAARLEQQGQAQRLAKAKEQLERSQKLLEEEQEKSKKPVDAQEAAAQVIAKVNAPQLLADQRKLTLQAAAVKREKDAVRPQVNIHALAQPVAAAAPVASTAKTMPVDTMFRAWLAQPEQDGVRKQVANPARREELKKEMLVGFSLMQAKDATVPKAIPDAGKYNEALDKLGLSHLKM